MLYFVNLRYVIKVVIEEVMINFKMNLSNLLKDVEVLGINVL
jgi:hypothetical protein